MATFSIGSFTLDESLGLQTSGIPTATEDNNEAVRKLTSWAEDAISAIEDDGGFNPSDNVDGTVVGFEGLDSLKGEVLALKLVHSVRKLSPEEIARLAGQALELLPQANKTGTKATERTTSKTETG